MIQLNERKIIFNPLTLHHMLTKQCLRCLDNLKASALAEKTFFQFI